VAKSSLLKKKKKTGEGVKRGRKDETQTKKQSNRKRRIPRKRGGRSWRVRLHFSGKGRRWGEPRGEKLGFPRGKNGRLVVTNGTKATRR